MPRGALTGSRIRERRMLLGMRQAELARAAGISPSYLNLIEHNRRRVTDAHLSALATALDVDPSALTEGAGAAVIQGLRGAAAAVATPPMPELDRIEEFAGRLPGWAALLAAQHLRIRTLERAVVRLTDRMAHDPHLSSALHEVLSAVTSVRSTAAIITGTEDLEPEWRARFHRNLQEDTERLAAGAEALVAYLDASDAEEAGLASPQEEVEGWLAGTDYHLAALERPDPPAPAAFLAGERLLASGSARILAAAHAARYLADARAVPLPRLRAALADLGPDPGALSQRLGVGLPVILRRLAALPAQDLAAGLVICDGSGTLTFRKPLDGFGLPRFGGACPLWPLYQALARPMTPVRQVIEMADRVPRRFLCYAICAPSHPGGFDGPVLAEAMMLILPSSPPQDAAPAQPVGTSCRICPRAACPARREPSLMPASGPPAGDEPDADPGRGANFR
ncbi:short-chain fatty acyl-CoA regulator family protein [Halodurantibacterium flavum]|uniref:Short-chain fatty acyl-CoA regulator family protein n=1 Tax=Halodurantibacterium flavum TaxID=1382802 RepID=A0ABW4SBY4_9RHOB